jgi:hypothetical protein
VEKIGHAGIAWGKAVTSFAPGARVMMTAQRQSAATANLKLYGYGADSLNKSLESL